MYREERTKMRGSCRSENWRNYLNNQSIDLYAQTMF